MGVAKYSAAAAVTVTIVCAGSGVSLTIDSYPVGLRLWSQAVAPQPSQRLLHGVEGLSADLLPPLGFQ